jgi:hypothetical protein
MIQFFESPLGLWIRFVVYIAFALYLLRSGISPNPSEPRKWYDRAIRISGGGVFVTGALFGAARIMGWVRW